MTSNQFLSAAVAKMDDVLSHAIATGRVTAAEAALVVEALAARTQPIGGEGVDAELDALEAWPLGGYAPGGYMNKCFDCGESFDGDKRAIQCLPCAVKATKRKLIARARLATPPPEHLVSGGEEPWASIPTGKRFGRRLTEDAVEHLLPGTLLRFHSENPWWEPSEHGPSYGEIVAFTGNVSNAFPKVGPHLEVQTLDGMIYPGGGWVYGMFQFVSDPKPSTTGTGGTHSVEPPSREGAESGWRDIASAPKDGTKIDLWVYFPACGDDPVRGLRKPDSHWSDDHGWVLQDGFYLSQYLAKPQATHWSAIPPPPTSEEK